MTTAAYDNAFAAFCCAALALSHMLNGSLGIFVAVIILVLALTLLAVGLRLIGREPPTAA